MGHKRLSAPLILGVRVRLYAACATLSLLSVLGLGGCVELSSLEGLHPREKPTVRCLGKLDKA